MARADGFSRVTFYEAPEQRLARAGATLARRLERGKGVWRLELPRPGDGTFAVEQPGGPAAPPARIIQLLPAFLRGGGVKPTIAVRVRSGNGGDDVEVLEGLHRTDALRVEPGALGTTILDLAGDHAEPPDEAIGHLRAMLETQYAEILRHDPGVRLDLHPEDVHRLRVAVRRARAVLRAARPVLDPEWSEPLRDELKWLGSSLGPRRDLDVLVGRLRSRIEELDQPERTAAESLVASLEQERGDAQALALETLSSERYLALLDSVEAAARGPRVRRGQISLGRLARREFRRLSKVAGKLGPGSTDADLHRARILGKRARYAAELAEPEVGKPARQFVVRAKDLQDVLGAHQDAIVAEARLRGMLAGVSSSGAAFAAGRLVEGERLRRREARQALPKAWRTLERSGRQAWG